MTDFFLSPWDEGLMAETICGYCPALVSILMYLGGSVFDSPEIAALLKNLQLQEIPQPLVSSICVEFHTRSGLGDFC